MYLYENLFTKIDKLVGGLEKFMKDTDGYLKLKSGGYMDLHVDRLGSDRISLAHNYKQNGDLMADPDMEIRIDLEHRVAEALTYQQDSLGVFQRVYPEPGKVDIKAKKQLNNFLNQWLNNLKHQGFYVGIKS